MPRTRILLAVSAASLAMTYSGTGHAADLLTWQPAPPDECNPPPAYPAPIPPQDVLYFNLPFAVQTFWVPPPSRAWQIMCLQLRPSTGRHLRRINGVEAQIIYKNYLNAIGHEPRKAYTSSVPTTGGQ